MFTIFLQDLNDLCRESEKKGGTMSINQLEQNATRTDAGMVSMDGCARETLVRGQNLATAEGHIRNRRGSTHEYLAPPTKDIGSRII